MTTVSQTATPSFTPPPAAVPSLTLDSANAKAKVAAYFLAPAAGAPAVSTVNLLKSLTGKGLFASLVGAATLPLPFTTPTTQTGFGAYRQCPNLGLARNLAINGGLIAGSHGWTLDSHASVVTDSLSPSGYALRTVATAIGQASWQNVLIEGGKTYRFAVQMRGDAANAIEAALFWLDVNGTLILQATVSGAVTPGAAYAEYTSAALVAPGNARTAQVLFYPQTAGIWFCTALRAMQQATAPAAWTAAHQQYIGRGLAIYEASTNRATDGDMEAVGVASWTATVATLTKDTTNPFAGTRRLKVVTTANQGNASQVGALAAGQAITASVRVIGGNAGSGIDMYSTPSNALIASDLGTSADWVTRKVSGVIAVGDTGWLVRLIGGTGVGVTSYFDNLAIENKAYDTMNADPSGQAFALASRTVSRTTLPTPTGLDVTSFAAAGSYRPDHAGTFAGTSRILLMVAVDANNYVVLFLTAGGAIQVYKDRAGVISSVASDGGALAIAAGDTVNWAYRYDTTNGLALWTGKNGGAVTKYTATSPETLIPISGTLVIDIGTFGVVGSGFEQDGTTGVVRLMRGGLSDATMSARVLAPYADPDDNDLAVWGFEGATYQVPSFDDHLVKLGTAYDWRADSNATGANAATAQGQLVTGTVAALADSVWLKVPSDPTKNFKFPVKYEEGLHKNYPRRMSLLDPLSGSAKIATMGPNAYGAEAIKLRTILPTATGHDTQEATLLAILNLTADLWLQDPFGGLRKVRAPNLDVHDFPLWQWDEMTFVEVQ